MAKGNKHSRSRFRKWLNSYNDVSSWLERKCPDIEQLLEKHGGLVKIETFLPPFVADGILELLESIDDSTWKLTAAQDDYVHNNIRHEFLSVKQGPPCLQDVFRVFTLLLPDSLFTFSAAKYCKAGHIVPHDDRAYTNVQMDDGSVQLCSRNIACIYYLTKDWTDADGGQLVDLEAAGGPQVYVPKYNSMIAFTIPRWHEVKPVTGNRPRFSVFGWFLEPGQLYPLTTSSDVELQPPQPPQQQQQHPDVPIACCTGAMDSHKEGQNQPPSMQTKVSKKKKRLQKETVNPQAQRQQDQPQHRKVKRRKHQALCDTQLQERQHITEVPQLQHKQQHAKKRKASEVPSKRVVAKQQARPSHADTCSIAPVYRKKVKKKAAAL